MLGPTPPLPPPVPPELPLGRSSGAAEAARWCRRRNRCWGRLGSTVPPLLLELELLEPVLPLGLVLEELIAAPHSLKP